MLGAWEIKNLAAEDLRTRAVLPTFKEQIAPLLYKLAQGAGEDKMSPKSLCKASTSRRDSNGRTERKT